MQPATRLVLLQEHWQRMLDHVEGQLPEEACGLIAGKGGQALEIIQVTNTLHSPTRFRMEPVEQLQALLLIDDNQWELIGIYHSHPNGPPHPSETDIAESYYPEAVHLIWWRQAGNWHCRGFVIQAKQFHEIQLVVQ